MPKQSDPIHDPAGLLPLLTALDPLDLGALADHPQEGDAAWLRALCGAAALSGVGALAIRDAVAKTAADAALDLRNARATAEAALRRAQERGRALQRLAGATNMGCVRCGRHLGPYAECNCDEPTAEEIASAVATLTEVRRPLLERLRARASMLRSRAAGRTGRIAEILRDRAEEAELAAVELEGSLEDLASTVTRTGSEHLRTGWVEAVLGKAKPAAA
jgi:hypothetical protein